MKLLYLALPAVALSRSIFQEKSEANSVLTRNRRANGDGEETFMPSDLERECVEELCSQEEYTEALENSNSGRRPRLLKSHHASFKTYYQDCWNAVNDSEYFKTETRPMNFKKICLLSYHNAFLSNVKLPEKMYDVMNFVHSDGISDAADTSNTAPEAGKYPKK